MMNTSSDHWTTAKPAPAALGSARLSEMAEAPPQRQSTPEPERVAVAYGVPPPRAPEPFHQVLVSVPEGDAKSYCTSELWIGYESTLGNGGTGFAARVAVATRLRRNQNI